jgi:hypothetical protein
MNWQCWADLGFSKNCWFWHLKKNQNQRTINSKYFTKTLKELLGLSVLCWFFNFFFFPGQSQGQVFEILTSTGYAHIWLI